MERGSGRWDAGHNPYVVSGGHPYPTYYEQSQGWPAAEQSHHSFSYPPPPPPPPYPYYSHVGSTSNYHNTYPPAVTTYGSFYPPPPQPQPPQGSADFSLNPPSVYPSSSFHSPETPPSPHLSAYPYPHVSGHYYPSRPTTRPLPHAVEPDYSYNPHYPSSQLTSPSLHHTSGSFRIDNEPGALSYWQAEGSFSSTEQSFTGQQHPHSLSHNASWSCGSSDCYFPHDMAGTPASGALVPYSGELRSLKYHLLYGSLDVWIHSATNLPNMDTFSDSLRQCLVMLEPCQQVFPKLQETISKKITSDPYVSLVLKGATLARTTVRSNNQNPVWDEHFVLHVAHKVADIELIVKDNDMVGAQYIGEVKIPAEMLLSKPIQGQFFDLLNKDGKPCNPGAQLKLSLKYFPVYHEDPLYRYGVGAGPYYGGVPDTYFPLRKGGRLTLYQDAHVSDKSLPEIKLERGMKFEHKSCWEDIFQAIVEAQHLIYIAGWSIYTKIKLVRDNDKQRDEAAYKNLGELLKWKAQSGAVRVLLLVWDDKTSHAIINNAGVMGTHDEETRNFFRHSSVKCLLAPRYADSKLSWFKQQVVGTIYTHHQKLVIVDTKGPPGKRRLTAFIGGLDLCDGRYDTPEHTLFSRLNTDFKDDYHNPTFQTKVDSGGPRQPWHDLHCKIEGPAVYDVLTNFEQRWRKVSKWHIGRHDNYLIDFDQVSWAIKGGQENLNVTEESDPESWHIQVFRSIDSGSVKGFPKDANEAEKQKLVGRKNIAIDMSIQRAYIKAIRSAQHFIYIENQYFLGSSFAWPGYKDAGANHLVPIELALKIVSKIKARKPFSVYVVIPMWPEGVPHKLAVQEILFFQSQTMEMMYMLIAEALKEEQLEETHHPTDFLNFFCLANRELKRENEPSPSVPPVEGSNQAKAFKSRRFMIYVHAKGMIVDDEYVIIGSANINQRSMDGSRDTEIAMGAYQPYHTWARIHAPPRGQVYGYRMSLWAEHLRASESCFMEPWSSECVKKVQSLTEQYWKQFSAEEVTEMEGHLLPYPIKVERTGKVVALPNFEVFPDVGGKVLGGSTPKLPDNLTS